MCNHSGEDLRILYLLTCKHRHNYGVSVASSVHASEAEAYAHMEDVKKNFDFEPENEEEYFEYNIEVLCLNINRLAKTTHNIT